MYSIRKGELNFCISSVDKPYCLDSVFMLSAEDAAECVREYIAPTSAENPAAVVPSILPKSLAELFTASSDFPL